MGLIIGIIVAAVVVLGGGITGIVLASGSGHHANSSNTSAGTGTPTPTDTTDAGGDTGSTDTGGSGSGSYDSPDSLVNAYVDSVNSQSQPPSQIMCDTSSGGGTQLPSGMPSMPAGTSVSASAAGPATVNGDSATATVNMAINMGGTQSTVPMNLDMSNSGGGWCISNMNQGTPNIGG